MLLGRGVFDGLRVLVGAGVFGGIYCVAVAEGNTICVGCGVVVDEGNTTCVGCCVFVDDGTVFGVEVGVGNRVVALGVGVRGIAVLVAKATAVSVAMGVAVGSGVLLVVDVRYGLVAVAPTTGVGVVDMWGVSGAD